MNAKKIAFRVFENISDCFVDGNSYDKLTIEIFYVVDKEKEHAGIYRDKLPVKVWTRPFMLREGTVTFRWQRGGSSNRWYGSHMNVEVDNLLQFNDMAKLIRKLKLCGDDGYQGSDFTPEQVISSLVNNNAKYVVYHPNYNDFVCVSDVEEANRHYRYLDQGITEDGSCTVHAWTDNEASAERAVEKALKRYASADKIAKWVQNGKRVRSYHEPYKGKIVDIKQWII